MFALLLALGAQDLPAQRVNPVATDVAENVTWLDIPNDIARAMVPYMNCFVSKFNVARNAKGSADLGELKAVTQQQCARVRDKAQEKAERILAKRSAAPPEERSAVVEKALESIEGVYDETDGTHAAGPASRR